MTRTKSIPVLIAMCLLPIGCTQSQGADEADHASCATLREQISSAVYASNSLSNSNANLVRQIVDGKDTLGLLNEAIKDNEEDQELLRRQFQTLLLLHIAADCPKGPLRTLISEDLFKK